MKLVCDACQSKYAISDDKVRGKVFKIRCKKCSNVIVVRGAAEPVEETAPAVEEGWYAVIDQAQIGPLAASEIERRCSAGEIDGETYLWREGMTDWLPVAEVPAFAALVAKPAARVEETGDLFGPPPERAAHDEAAGRLRGERNESSVLFSLNKLTELAAPMPSRAQPASTAAPAAPGTEGSGLIDIRSMASAYLGPSGGAKPAATTTGIGSIDDLPVFAGGGFSEPAVLVPLAARSSRPKLLYAAIGASALAVVAAIIVVVVVVRDRTPSANAATVATNEVRSDSTGASGANGANNTHGATGASTTTGANGAATNGASGANNANTASGASGANNASGATAANNASGATAPNNVHGASNANGASGANNASGGNTASGANNAHGATGAHGTHGAAGAAHTTAHGTGSTGATADAGTHAHGDASHAEPHGNPLTTAAAEACDQVHCMVSSDDPCCARLKQPPAAGGTTTHAIDTSLPERLDRNMIKDGVGKVMARAQACGSKSPARGTVRIAVKVDVDGHITSASVREAADAALGDCVLAAMKQASFAKTQAGGSFTFPFVF